MALNATTLKAQILVLLNDSFAKTEDPEAALDDFADQLSNQITNHIKTLTVTFPPGTVNVAGSATNQTNALPVTGATIT